MATRSIQPGLVKGFAGALHKSSIPAVKHAANPASLPFTAPGKGGNSMPTGHVTNSATAPKSGKGGGEGNPPVSGGGTPGLPFTK